MVSRRQALLSVIIVTYNSSSTIKDCLDSLINSEPAAEIIVVDNNSSDQTVKILENYKNKINLIISPTNVGLSKAINKVVSLANGDYLSLLNPDCKIVEKNSLSRLIEQLEQYPEYGLIGPQLIHADGKAQLSVRNLPTIGRAVEEFLLRRKNSYEFYLPAGNDLQSVESIVAACVVMSKSLFKKIGGMDERYFLYFEDMELCRQVRNAGYKVGYYPQVQVKHIEGVSGQGSEKTRQFAIESAKKYQGVLGYHLISLIGRLGHKIYG